MATEAIDCTFDSESDNSGDANDQEADTTLEISLNFFGVEARLQFRFPLSALPAGADVTNTTFQMNKISENVEGGEDMNVHAYNTDGTSDPDPDDQATKFTRSKAGTALATGLVGNGTGTVSIDLGTTADGHVEANIDTPDFYALGVVTDADWDSGEVISVEAIENAGSDPATLTVVYTPAGATGTIAVTMQAATASMAGTHEQSGAVAATLQRAFASLTGVMQPEGQLAATVQPPTFAGTGTSVSAGASGTIAATLQAALSSLTGAQTQSGAVAATMQPLTFAGAGAQQFIASLAAQMQAALMNATGSQVYVGTLAAELQQPTFAATGFMVPAGAMIVELQQPIFAASGVMVPAGAIAATMQEPTFAGEAFAGYEGALAATITAMVFTAQGFMLPAGTLAATLQRLMFAGTGEHLQTGIITAILQAATFAATGEHSQAGTISAEMQALIFAGVALHVAQRFGSPSDVVVPSSRIQTKPVSRTVVPSSRL